MLQSCRVNFVIFILRMYVANKGSDRTSTYCQIVHLDLGLNCTLKWALFITPQHTTPPHPYHPTNRNSMKDYSHSRRFRLDM